ncbi:MAG: hypothetical protein IJ693_07045 [Bacteroidaceae bacterium]|nr:hypothetical protein [Bacteroidaceae bacterium]
MAKHIRVLTVKFDLPISYKEIPMFRGAVLKSMGDHANLLYHNHTGEDTFRYAYPLIQYKRLNGKAAITCVEEGADVIGQFFSEMSNTIIIGKREAKCEVGRIQPSRMLVQTWEGLFQYHLLRWLPLNAKNYHIYQMTEDENERKALLENILKANLLSMLKGLDIHLESELVVSITQLSEPYIIYHKNVGMMAFNAKFTSNLSIPNNLGIGKNVSIGCGIVCQERKRDTEKESETEKES